MHSIFALHLLLHSLFDLSKEQVLLFQKSEVVLKRSICFEDKPIQRNYFAKFFAALETQRKVNVEASQFQQRCCNLLRPSIRVHDNRIALVLIHKQILLFCYFGILTRKQLIISFKHFQQLSVSPYTVDCNCPIKPKTHLQLSSKKVILDSFWIRFQNVLSVINTNFSNRKFFILQNDLFKIFFPLFIVNFVLQETRMNSKRWYNAEFVDFVLMILKPSIKLMSWIQLVRIFDCQINHLLILIFTSCIRGAYNNIVFNTFFNNRIQLFGLIVKQMIVYIEIHLLILLFHTNYLYGGLRNIH